MKFLAAIAAASAFSTLNQEKLYEAIYDQELLEIPGPAYQPWMSHDPEDGDLNPPGAHIRATPARYAADSDDIFMRSVVGTYAQEGAECDEDPVTLAPVNCKPTGVFTLDKSSARALATEVLGTHAGLSGDALSSYLDTYFDKAWGHFDVMQTGSIAADKAGALSRFLLSDQRIQLGEAAF